MLGAGRPSHLRRRGFSLVEVLVSLVIIAIVAALIHAGIRSARDRAQAAAAQSNMRQIFLAATYYAAENGGRLPKVAATGIGGNAAEFFFLMKEDGVADLESGALAAYIDDDAILLAPGDDRLKADGSPGRNFSFSFNFLINKGELLPGASGPTGFEKALDTLRFSQIVDPAQKILIFEEDTPNDAFCVWFIDRPTERHQGKANFLFADGHAEFLPAADVFGNPDYNELVPPGSQY